MGTGFEQSRADGSVKMYEALLSQTGTGDPTIESNGTGANTPLFNTIGAIVWTRVPAIGPGNKQYLGTLAGAFPATKTMTFSVPIAGGGVGANLTRVDNDTVIIEGCGDNVLTLSPVMIKVYS